MPTSLNRDARICIIGAGAAGISAAWYLRKHGYQHVTVLEESGQVGGKCLSLKHSDGTIDLGAVLLMPDYRRVMSLASEVGAMTSALPAFRAVRLTPNGVVSRSIPQLIFEKHGIIAFLAAAKRFLSAHRRHSGLLRKPGFAGMSAELALPFGKWAEQYGMEPLLTQFQLPFGAFGYGDVGGLATGYVLRYISARLFEAMALAPLTNLTNRGWPRRFTEGFGEFWQRVGAGFDVRLNAHLERIDRTAGVTVAWTEDSVENFRREEIFDALVIACPPRAVAAVLDHSSAEEILFRSVRTKAYSVTACETTGIPDSISFLESPRGPGHLIQFWKPSPGPGICAFYTSPPAGMPVDEIMTRVRGDLRLIYPQAGIGRVIRHIDWSYFPHVDADTFGAGFFDNLEAIQGQRATWYGGSLPAFESVESVVAYSEHLVKRLISSGGLRQPLARDSAGVLVWNS